MPPKAKKSAKPKLTPEEKKLRKLARREAARLRKIEQEKQQQRDFLAREVRYTEKNIQKILQKWREIMRRVRQPDLYDDYLSLQRSIEHQFDIKDSIIQMLLQMLDEANEQYNMNLSHHVESINTMLGIYATGIDEMNMWYRTKLDNFADELSTFRSLFNERTAKRMLHLEMILWSMEDRTEDRTMNLLADTTAKFDEEIVRSGEKLQNLRADLEKQQENQWLTLRNTLNDHLNNTAERRRVVTELTVVDQQAAAIIQRQRKMTERAYDSIQKLNRAITVIENSPPSTLLKERNSLQSAEISLRARMDRGIARDNCQMAHLVSASNSVLQTLNSLSKEGERIIRLVNLCRRLETEDEKVLPFPEWAFGDGDQEDEGYDDQNETCETDVDDGSASEGGFMTDSKPVYGECLCVPDDLVPHPADSGFCREVKDFDSCSSIRSKHYLKKLDKRVCELSPPISLSKTRATLKQLGPLWGRVGRANIDVIDLGDVLNNLRAENAELRAKLLCYVRMGAPPSSSQDPQPRGPPTIPLMEPPPGYPPRNKFKLLPPVETRL